MTHLLDTSTCIALIRRKSPKLLQRLEALRPGDLAISTITLAELEYGVSKSREPARNALALLEFCAALVMLPFDANAAGIYGRIRAALERAGTRIGPLDTLIAAHALAAGLKLITANVHDFARVPGLTVADWTQHR